MIITFLPEHATSRDLFSVLRCKSRLHSVRISIDDPWSTRGSDVVDLLCARDMRGLNITTVGQHGSVVATRDFILHCPPERFQSLQRIVLTVFNVSMVNTFCVL